MKLLWHKLRHWEYWPVYIVYLPTLFLWIWWTIRFRSIKFFSYANPAITNGGLYGDRKMDIYKLLPHHFYPKTILITKNDKHASCDLVLSNQFQYPIIVKPDIGKRGKDVQKITNESELMHYALTLNQDFLVQEIIEYPNEIGLFYYRMPDEADGKISGITLKEFLTVQGNGNDTIEQLLKKNPRYELQIPKLKNYIDLQKILNKEEEHCLVPFGNHNRGTLFLDGKEFITIELEKSINEILKNVDGFYFGRLDIRYQSFEALEAKKHFSIIEINGVKSEPTHIYDPKHSFWYGQKEILKHQLFMKTIIEKVYLRKRNPI